MTDTLQLKAIPNRAKLCERGYYSDEIAPSNVIDTNTRIMELTKTLCNLSSELRKKMEANRGT